MKTAADVMEADVVTCQPEEKVAVVVKRIREADVSGLPVVDEDGGVEGVVSEADLLDLVDTRQEESNIWLPSPFEAFELPLRAFPWREWLEKHDVIEEAIEDVGETPVEDVMNTPARTITPSTAVDEAAGIMVRTGYNRLPVVDPDSGRLVGIVTRGDALDALSGGSPGES